MLFRSGGKRLVLMPLIRPSTYSDKDLQELCDTLADTENAIFVLTSIIEESYGKLRPGKREQKLIAACEKLGYCVQITKPGRAALQELAQETERIVTLLDGQIVADNGGEH